MPTPVGDYAAGVYADSLIYYVGGYDGFGDVNIVQVYHPATNSWSYATSKPGTAVAGLRGSINLNNIVVAGGFSQVLATSMAEAHKGVIDVANPLIINWTTLALYPGGPSSRLGAGTVFMDFLPYVIFTGGDPTGAGTAVKNDCWAYDVIQDKWLMGPNKITGVSNFSDLVGMIHNDSLWMAAACGYDGTAFASINEWLNLGQFLWVNVKNPESRGIVSVYPNPAGDRLNILLNRSYSRLEIMDLAGRLIHRENIPGNTPMIAADVSNIVPGAYLLVLADNNGTVTTTRFIKQ